MQESLLSLSFLDTNSPSMAFLRCKALSIFKFFFLWTISLSLKIGPEYLTRRTPQVFMPYVQQVFEMFSCFSEGLISYLFIYFIYLFILFIYFSSLLL